MKINNTKTFAPDTRSTLATGELSPFGHSSGVCRAEQSDEGTELTRPTPLRGPGETPLPPRQGKLPLCCGRNTPAHQQSSWSSNLASVD